MQAQTQPRITAPAVRGTATTLPWWAVALPVLMFTALLLLTVLHRTP